MCLTLEAKSLDNFSDRYTAGAWTFPCSSLSRSRPLGHWTGSEAGTNAASIHCSATSSISRPSGAKPGASTHQPYTDGASASGMKIMKSATCGGAQSLPRLTRRPSPCRAVEAYRR